MRKFVIPDIRGELALLRKLLDKIGPSQDDCLLFLGSYLGPGPDSKGVIEFLLKLKTTQTNCSFLRGCYEYMFGKALEENTTWEVMSLWGQMSGHKIFESYASRRKLRILNPLMGGKLMEARIPMEIPEKHIHFMQHDLHQWYEDDTFPFVACHAGGHPGLFGGKLETEEQTLFAERDWWLQDGRQIPGKTVIFSHVPFKKVFRRAGKLGLDLGCGFGGSLAAFEMVSDSVTVVN